MGVKLGKPLWRHVWGDKSDRQSERCNHWVATLREQGFDARLARGNGGFMFVLVHGNRDTQMRALTWLPARGMVLPSWWNEDPAAAGTLKKRIQKEAESQPAPDFDCDCGNHVPYSPDLPGYYCTSGCGFVKHYVHGVKPTQEEK